jgi:mRNA-degrading endonuclease RelE of RelBE toxin-antitoxin system
VTRTRAFSHIELTRQFEKSYRRLSAERKTQCDDALEQLLEEPVAPGLHLKPIRPSNKYWEARMNKGDRLILYPDGAMAYLMDVVTHDEISKWSK